MDYQFARAVVDVVATGAPTDELTKLFRADALYAGGARAALELATFTGNFDAGRLAYFIRKSNPQISDAKALRRVMLGYAMLLTLRGVPGGR